PHGRQRCISQPRHHVIPDGAQRRTGIQCLLSRACRRAGAHPDCSGDAMTLYRYKAVSASGETLDGEMEAGSEDEVIAKLQEAGHLPLEAREAQGDTAGALRALLKRKTFSNAQIVQFTQQLATLMVAGQPLDRSLQILLDLP